MEQSTESVKPARARTKRLVALVALVTLGAAVLGGYRLVDASRHSTRQTLCVHNLKVIASGLRVYADEHDGRLPERLSELWPKYLPGLDALICPELQADCLRRRGVPHPFPPNASPDDIEALCSYTCVPGHTMEDPGDTVVVYEKRDNHLGRGRSLLYLDGHGAWEPPQNWRNGPPNKALPPGI